MRALPARGITPRIRYEVERLRNKNKLKFLYRMQRGYPPVRAADFVAPREMVSDRYSQPCDARYPVLCMDKQHKQRLADQRTPQPARPSRHL